MSKKCPNVELWTVSDMQATEQTVYRDMKANFSLWHLLLPLAIGKRPLGRPKPKWLDSIN